MKSIRPIRSSFAVGKHSDYDGTGLELFKDSTVTTKGFFSTDEARSINNVTQLLL